MPSKFHEADERGGFSSPFSIISIFFYLLFSMPFPQADTLYRRPRGRPKSTKRLEIKTAALKEIRPRPRLNDGILLEPIHEDHHPKVLEAGDKLEQVMDMQSPDWLDEDLLAFELSSTLPTVTNLSSPGQQSNALSTAPMSRRQNPRPYEARIDPNLEWIGPCSILMNGTPRDNFVTYQRVLHSGILEHSYIYEETLGYLAISYLSCVIWKTSTRFGLLEPKGFTNICIARDPFGAEPALVRFYVLPGAPPPGGVNFMVGNNAVNVLYSEHSTPEQHAGQNVQH
ncbi:hypothetical protein V8F20_002201 [Naviculisporaceae sp. PSN 640]